MGGYIAVSYSTYLPGLLVTYNTDNVLNSVTSRVLCSKGVI